MCGGGGGDLCQVFTFNIADLRWITVAYFDTVRPLLVPRLVVAVDSVSVALLTAVGVAVVPAATVVAVVALCAVLAVVAALQSCGSGLKLTNFGSDPL